LYHGLLCSYGSHSLNFQTVLKTRAGQPNCTMPRRTHGPLRRLRTRSVRNFSATMHISVMRSSLRLERDVNSHRYRPPDSLIDFLRTL
jgi:hypothetical protein